jgi:hypothetical protein
VLFSGDFAFHPSKASAEIPVILERFPPHFMKIPLSRFRFLQMLAGGLLRSEISVSQRFQKK